MPKTPPPQGSLGAWQQLRERAQHLALEEARLAGRCQELVARLGRDFGVADEAEATELLKKLEGELRRAEKELADELAVFQEKYGEHLR